MNGQNVTRVFKVNGRSRVDANLLNRVMLITTENPVKAFLFNVDADSKSVDGVDGNDVTENVSEGTVVSFILLEENLKRYKAKDEAN